MRSVRIAVILSIVSFAPAALRAQSLDRIEQGLRANITAAHESQIVYLQRVVDIPSSTLNLEGVRKVRAVFRASFDSLGFTTSWAAVLGALGSGSHAPGERVDLKSLTMQTERAALLFYRLGKRPASQFARQTGAN